MSSPDQQPEAEDEHVFTRQDYFDAVLASPAVGFTRSVSAPPTMTISDDPSQNPSVNPNGSLLINGESVQPDDPRLSPAYYAYYYSQRPLDPRLPPPLFNWSSWHLANRAKGMPEMNQQYMPYMGNGDMSGFAAPINHLPNGGPSANGFAGAFANPVPASSAHRNSNLMGGSADDSDDELTESKKTSLAGGSHNNGNGFLGRGTSSSLLSSNTSPSKGLNSSSGADSSSNVSPNAGSKAATALSIMQQSSLDLAADSTVKTDTQANQPRASSLPIAPPSHVAPIPTTSMPRTPSLPPVGPNAPPVPLTFSPSLASMTSYPNPGMLAILNSNGTVSMSPVMMGMNFPHPSVSLPPNLSLSGSGSNIFGPRPPHAIPSHVMAAFNPQAAQPFKQAFRPLNAAFGPMGPGPIPDGGFGLVRPNPPMAMNGGVPVSPLGPTGLSPMNPSGLSNMIRQQQSVPAGFANSAVQPASQPAQPSQVASFGSSMGQANVAGGRANFNKNRPARQPLNNVNLANTSGLQASLQSNHAMAAAAAALGSLPPHLSNDPSVAAATAAAAAAAAASQMGNLSLETRSTSPTASTSSSPTGGNSYRHSLVDEYRLNKSSTKVTLMEIVQQDIAVDLSMDQHGSRLLQQRLELANEAERTCLFDALLPEALRLCSDVFGNYVVQKFLELGTDPQRNQLAAALKGHVLSLSLQMYGCRVVQKALEVLPEDTQSAFLGELRGHVHQCVKDQNGNHVIQKCIERVPAGLIGFIVQDFRGQIIVLASHPYGCRVIQRLLEHCNEEQKAPLLEEILNSALDLIQDQYGNYVIQHVLEHGLPWQRSRIIHVVQSHITQLAKHKFASNVVEKSFLFGTEDERVNLIETVVGVDSDANSPITHMVRDQYANYVVQKILDATSGNLRIRFIEGLKVKVPALRKITYGKHIIARIEKLTGKSF